MKTFTRDELRYLLGESLVDVINRWLSRGDGVAVYLNVDLGHYGAGEMQFASFGSEVAILETDTPPVTLPDIGGHINWRYRLQGTYRGEPL